MKMKPIPVLAHFSKLQMLAYISLTFVSRKHMTKKPGKLSEKALLQQRKANGWIKYIMNDNF